MKVLPALFFVALGIWLAFSYPDLAATAFGYIQEGVNWVIAFLKSLMG